MDVADETRQIEAVLARFEPCRPNVVPLLQEVQRAVGYLSQDAVARISRYVKLSENEVFGVATFYTQFRFRAPGRHQVKVCQGTACHVRGSALIMEELCSRLGIGPGETTEDREFSVERVACFGSCALAPVVVVDEVVHGLVTAAGADALVRGNGE